MKNRYDVAAYFWPSYTGDEPRARIFWPEGYGEWQTVKAMEPRFEGHEWPRKPRWGYINEADPYVMEMELSAASDHGINVFIFDWYWYDDRPFLEQSLDNGYLKARNNDKVKFIVMWANHEMGSAWDKRTAHEYINLCDFARGEEKFKTIVDRVIKMYFVHDSYYKIGGKPVFQIYDLGNFIKGLGGIDGARKALDILQNKAISAGFDGVHTQITLRSHADMEGRNPAAFGFDGTVRDVANLLPIDSLTDYVVTAYIKEHTEYKDFLPEMINNWDYCRERYSAPYFPNVSLGWDPTPRFIPTRKDVMLHDSPELALEALVKARKYVDDHPELPARLVTVNSWNEWTEGSYLMPDDRSGYGYLEAVKHVFVDGIE